MYFGINEYRKGTTPDNLAYKLLEIHMQMVSTTDLRLVLKLANSKIMIIEQDTFVTGNYYCVRAGIGFSDTTI